MRRITKDILDLHPSSRHADLRLALHWVENAKDDANKYLDLNNPEHYAVSESINYTFKYLKSYCKKEKVS